MLVCTSCIKNATGLLIDSKDLHTCCICNHVDLVVDIPKEFYLFVWEMYRGKNK